MKIWSRIVGSIYVLTGIFFVFSLFTLSLNEQFCEKFLDFVKINSNKISIFSIVVLFIGIIWIVNWFDYIYKTKAVSFDNPTGKVKISLKAIEDYITAMIMKNIETIKAIKVKVNVSSRGLETKINLKLLAHLNIPEVCSNIQELTRNYLQDTIGVERISDIEIYVSNIIEGIETTKSYEKEESPEN